MSYTPQKYTWAQFVAAVDPLLTVDADRAGTSDFKLATLRQGVIHLQNLLPGYRKRHETIYRPEDCVYEGKASKGIKPPESALRDCWLCAIQTRNAECGVRSGTPTETGKASRRPVTPWPWAKRMEMVHGRIPVNDGVGCIAVDPEGYEFYVYPAIYDGWMFSMFWDGLKLDFKADEETPFDELFVGAVKNWVKAEFAREVEKDLAGHQSYMQSHVNDRRNLYLKKQVESGGS